MHNLRESEKAQDVVKERDLKNAQNSEMAPQLSRQVDAVLYTEYYTRSKDCNIFVLILISNFLLIPKRLVPL